MEKLRLKMSLVLLLNKAFFEIYETSENSVSNFYLQ